MLGNCDKREEGTVLAGLGSQQKENGAGNALGGARRRTAVNERRGLTKGQGEERGVR